MAERGLSGDAAQLANLGHAQSFERQFSRWAMLGLAFAILNTWSALAASLNLALPSGGPVAVGWGLVVAGVFNLALAASLAEFLSAFPTAGGQYYWVAICSPPSLRAGMSWITGWVNLSGWVALVATNASICSNLTINIIYLMHPSYDFHRWHQFLIYIGITLIFFLNNALLQRVLAQLNGFAICWSLVGFLVVCITVLACAAPDYATGEYVFATFINTTGWPDGLAWLLGLLQGSFSLTAFDAVAHLSEEIPNPSVEGPKIMVYCVLIGIGTGWLFQVVLLFVSGGLANSADIISSSAGPLLQIFYIATGNKAGAVCLLMLPLMCFIFGGTAVMTTSSRMTFAVARDGMLPVSAFWWKMNQKLQVPLNALLLNVFVVIVFGCIYLGSNVAFNAITASSVVALGISYALPPAMDMLYLRRKLPPRPFAMPEWLGWTANILGVAYTILTTVLFLFPPARPVTGSNMNYCIVAFGIIILISGLQWIFDGRKNYSGPRITVDDGVVMDGESNRETEQPVKS
ncbi:hypothetical protein PRZ48_012051 [Zasmidium cellare]|uniref:Uncharacterized protein n=1 Tax=Zasmidium cellare TaxID=395010 RepID=A0ABR0E3T5_ZASCE|nr:hypothetical protein PRZ48_012051 [Zasmidium cellare]